MSNLINPEDLALTESALNPKQLGLILKRTPEKYVRTRPAKGGGTWKYGTILFSYLIHIRIWFWC